MLQIWLIMSVNGITQLVEEVGSSTVDKLIFLKANTKFGQSALSQVYQTQ